jgi:magnesium-transporting ATPase (P-type)
MIRIFCPRRVNRVVGRGTARRHHGGRLSDIFDLVDHGWNFCALQAFFFVLTGAGWRYGQELAATDPIYLQATTTCLGTIILMQIVNVFLCRSATRSVFAVGIGGNALIVWGVALEAVLLGLYAYTP